MELVELLKKHQNNLFSLLGEGYSLNDFCSIDLSRDNPLMNRFNVATYDGLEQFIKHNLSSAQAKVGYGGYLERRLIYQASDYFKSEALDRCIHLGVDFWSSALTPIHAPYNAKVHSFQYNAKPYDYGTTIILEHELEGVAFFTLYGHLALASIKKLKKGQVIKKGEIFTAMGEPSENGGWVPHLHFQLITDMLDIEGDFVGVTSEDQLDYYQRLCPDPTSFLKVVIQS